MIRTAAYHAHVYFSPEEFAEAEHVCKGAAEKFSIPMGRMHNRPIGPHPTGSCQLTIPGLKADGVFKWLDENRGDLTVMVHALTGDDWTDHTEGVFWLGDAQPLKLSIFRKSAS